MKDVAKSLLCKPYVLLMLGLVCLPFLAKVVVCCPPDCSAEQAAVEAAETT